MACNRKSEPKEILGLNRITKKRLLELCKKNKLYQTPSLNDVLYLHYQGFQSIECLEEYTELKCLWLECNAISEIQGLDNQIKLKCLFLQSNLIKKIENLEYCKELDTINLSQNHIRKIENCGIDILPVLNTLNISSNYIKDSDGLKELENCINLSVLDLSNNRIDDILVVKIFNKMPELKVLVLQGNPVVSKIPQYRKTMTLECKKLTYLDSRPVFPKDRACAEAWKIGGYEGERKENERWNRRERKKMRDSVNATIRMRNKNRKPEDILTLLTSSDSEDESDAKKRSRQNDVGAGVSIDSIWDEVAEDSSDLTSETSTTDSNGQGNSSECCANEAGETPKIDEHKILNDCFENNTKVCHSAENEKSIKQFENKCGQDKSLDIDVKQIVEHYESIELKKHDNKTMMRADPDDDMKIMPKKIKIDIGEIELGQQSSENNVFSLNACSSSSRLSNNSLYSDEDSKDQYKDTVDAICHATMNNLSETDDFSTTPLQLQVENFNAKDEENYEPLKELEETMNTIIKKEYSERETERQVNFSSFNQNMLTVETQECSEINHQLKKDFEKLSSDMDNFMLQLQKDKDDRQNAMELLFDKIVPSQESSSASSENEAEVNMAEWKLENMVDQWERETRLKKDASNKMPEIRINSKPCKVETMIHCEDSQQETNLINKEINKEICCATIGDGIRPHKADIEQLENIQDVSNYDAIFTNNVDSQEPHAENDLTMEQQFPPSNLSALPADALSRISVDSEENDFEYIPMDITLLARNSHVALNSIEKEAKELKVLLQKLEDENMDLFKEINTESKCHAEEHSKENIFKDVQEKLLQKEYKEDSDKSIQRKYDEDLTLTSKNEIKITLQENANEQLTENFEELENESGKNEMEDENSKSSFGEQLVQEIIQCLELRTLKPKSYEFDIISDEEYSYSESIVEQEDLLFTKPIPDFLQSFKLFSKTISNEIKTPSIGKPNSCGLPELANRRKQQDLNTETHKSLDEQLQLFKEEQTKQIRRMVDRVYAQKERYNDTIEVIDGKLMVRNKDTGEVKELPPPPKHFSDSDTEYDTAQSEENEDEACCSKSKQLRSDQSTHERTNDQRLSDCKGNWGFSRHKSDGWPISHKPNQRKSAENLITLALAQNRKSYLTENGNEDSSSDESHDEFFSLDQQNKPNLYGNIDAEFFNTLTLDHLKLSEQDEHHMNQCARSYEDMKTFLKLTKDEECSINENNENPHMLRNNDECCDEDLLLKKLMERAKEKEGFENGNKESNRNNYDVDINRMPYKICKEAVKIFEYKYEQNYHNASSSYPLAKALNEIESTSESVNENSTEVFGNNVYTFVFEEPETESVEDKEQLRGTEFVENEEELSRQDFMKNVLMRNISLQTCKAEEEKLSCTDLNSPKSADSILCPEKYSEEEKNEIESNVDVEGIAINNKFEFVSPKECLEQNSHHEPLPTEEYGTSNCRNSTIEFFKTTQSSESTPIISNHEDCIQTVSSVAANTSSSKTFVLKTLPDSKNNPIVLTDDNSQEQQNIFYNTDCEQHIYLESYLPDLSTNSPPSTQNQCFGKISLNDNNSTEYLTLNSPPLSSATTQPVENILPTDNFNENSQHSVKTTTSSVSKHYKLPLQVNTVNSQIPSQNAAYSDAYFKESENDSQSQDTSEKLETQEHDVLECNLEILGCNDEIIETITVNAELHYDY